MITTLENMHVKICTSIFTHRIMGGPPIPMRQPKASCTPVPGPSRESQRA